MGGSSNHKTNNAAEQPENCSLLKMFVPCSGACCEPGEPTHTGYKLGDPAVGYCMNGQMMVAKPLAPTDSCDDPFQGTLSNPPTWGLCSLEQWIKQHAGKDGAAGAVCDQAWMLPKIAAPRVSADEYLERMDNSAGLNGLVDPAGIVRHQLVHTATITRADMVASGMRPTDNAVRVKSYVNCRMDGNEITGTTDIDGSVIVILKTDTAVTDSMNASVNFNGNVAALQSGSFNAKDSYSEYHSLLVGQGDLTMTVHRKVSKASTAALPLDGSEGIDLELAQFRATTEIIEFFRADDGTNTVKGGCASTLT